jgi:hypothetical protein
MAGNGVEKSVFVNCPFDDAYRPMLHAMLFTLLAAKFRPRCALESDDASEVRIEKICRIIGECRLAIHDLSRVELDSATELPRFNMPFEFGVFYGAKRFGGLRHRGKTCLVFARRPYEYKAYISDIAGQDIQAHDSDPERAVVALRNWLRQFTGKVSLPDGTNIWREYNAFGLDVPDLCLHMKLGASTLTYLDFVSLATRWLKRRAGA